MRARAQLLVAVALGTACGAAPPTPSDGRLATKDTAFLAPELTPARYVYTSRMGVRFDDDGSSSVLPSPEPAILDGVRVIVQNGVVLGSARVSERLSGFRSMPSRLGGGFVVWSEGRTYRAVDFLGELRRIVDVGATGGARPWLSSIVLRTRNGLLDVDATSLAVRRFSVAGAVDALAVDGRRGAHLDALGRANVTADGGATWTDVLATRSTPIMRLGVHRAGGLVLTAPRAVATLRLSPGGELGALVDPSARPFAWLGEPRTTAPALAAFPAVSTALADETIAHAVMAGALLPRTPDGSPQRAVVARDRGLRVLATATALPIDDADLLGMDEKLAHCQPFSAPPTLLLACTGARAAALSLRRSLTTPALEITFPEPGTFVAGPRGRFGFAGRCGSFPPSGAEFGPGPARSPQGSEDEPNTADSPPPNPEPSRGLTDRPPDDDARFCSRIDENHWIEHRLRGEQARRLYRWIPGDAGRITALILGPREPATNPVSMADGVRVIHVDPDDRALGGGAFPAVQDSQKDAPYRSIDADYWEDADGAIRGWVRLPSEGASPLAVDATAQGRGARLLRVSNQRGGRSAGVRVDARGQITVHPLPSGVTEVVTGGRFGLAMAGSPEAERWFETVDGGVAWTPIAGPPVGRLQPRDGDAGVGCSALGCTWGTGIVRLGWGGPLPSADGPALVAAPASSTQPAFPTPRPMSLVCHAAADVAFSPAKSKKTPPVSFPLGDGALVSLDADSGVVSLARGGATTSALRLLRVPEVGRTRLTLARRDGGGVAIVGYSTSSGEVVAADLDLAKAEAGPLAALGRLDAIGACRGDKASHRFVAELRVSLRLVAPSGQGLLDQEVTTRVSLEAARGKLCARGVEADLPQAAKLSATFGARDSAEVTTAGKGVGARCEILAPAP